MAADGNGCDRNGGGEGDGGGGNDGSGGGNGSGGGDGDGGGDGGGGGGEGEGGQRVCTACAQHKRTLSVVIRVLAARRFDRVLSVPFRRGVSTVPSRT